MTSEEERDAGGLGAAGIMEERLLDMFGAGSGELYRVLDDGQGKQLELVNEL